MTTRSLSHHGSSGPVDAATGHLNRAGGRRWKVRSGGFGGTVGDSISRKRFPPVGSRRVGGGEPFWLKLRDLGGEVWAAAAAR